MAHLEGSFEQINERLGSIDRRLDTIDSRFGQLESRFESRFTWMLGTVIGTWATTILTIAFHH